VVGVASGVGSGVEVAVTITVGVGVGVGVEVGVGGDTGTHVSPTALVPSGQVSTGNDALGSGGGVHGLEHWATGVGAMVAGGQTV
jgi:hypothetical protein